MENKLNFSNKNFVLMVIGQIISLFGNAILRFALPLYLLDKTGSAVIFGVVSACSFIPMIILTPLGGVIADRVNKKYIMVLLDFITALIMIVFALFIGKVNLIFMIIVTLMILYGIQGAYQPAVQASLPFLVAKEDLLKGNAIINQVSALANLVGPVIGGLLYGIYGLVPILAVSIICFILAVVMEMVMKIPHTKIKTDSSMLSIIKSDIKISIKYIIKEKPILFKTIIIISFFNLFLTSMIIIGIPVIITNTLNMSSQSYGIAQGIIGLGAICGGILTGVLGRKLKISNCYMILFFDILALIPIALSLLFKVPSNITYLIITISCFLIMCISTIFSIQMITFIQGETPRELIGKVISICLTIGMCTQPLGQLLYGYLFEVLKDNIWIIIVAVFMAGGVIAIISKNIFAKLDVIEKVNFENQMPSLTIETEIN
ncbi:MAG: MFS transporter [Sarcina sp.]